MIRQDGRGTTMKAGWEGDNYEGRMGGGQL